MPQAQPALSLRFQLVLAVAGTTLALLPLAASQASNPWPRFDSPSSGSPAAIGAPANGCLAGAGSLPPTGPGFVSIRRERNRFYGHPELIRFVEDLAERLARRTDKVLMVGDLAQPRGGRMASLHASHQNGLDVDLWLELAENEDRARRLRSVDPDPQSMVSGDKGLASAWGPHQRFLIQAAAEDPRVDRLFVNPAIKRHLCAVTDEDRTWLRKVRPWWGHDAHIHVRLRCPTGSAGCARQPPPPAGDGCGAQLSWWFSEEAAKRAGGGTGKRDPIPEACQALLGAP